ncbi:unnamed protein product [Echinostoma caproni]|uniref:WW domain-containing protein n=1 Tax=Echinostoma caproni TaxID=27848 RepID=A0A183BE99_9TREM|nr:unnamed protein product [Echinostoma caproni]
MIRETPTPLNIIRPTTSGVKEQQERAYTMDYIFLEKSHCVASGFFSSHLRSSHLYEYRPASSAHTSSVSAHSGGMELTQAAKARYAQLRQQRKRVEPAERQPLPALHLHLSKDGTSPLPPGWQRAPNIKRQANHTTKDGSDGGTGEEVKSSDMYAYYYYHVRTRQTRWDPPVYPWDADPLDHLSGDTGEDDPEAPYNWGCASKYSVTHEEIEAVSGFLLIEDNF